MTLAQLEPSAQAPCTRTTLVALTGGAACAAGLRPIKVVATRAAARVAVCKTFIVSSVLAPIAGMFSLRDGAKPRYILSRSFDRGDRACISRVRCCLTFVRGAGSP